MGRASFRYARLQQYRQGNPVNAIQGAVYEMPSGPGRQYEAASRPQPGQNDTVKSLAVLIFPIPRQGDWDQVLFLALSWLLVNPAVPRVCFEEADLLVSLIFS